jgi:hypothetical protein
MHALLALDHSATSDQIRVLLSGQSDIREVSAGESVEEVLRLAAVDARLAGAVMIAGADGVFDPKTGATEPADLLGRILTGSQAFPALEPDPFHELADCVDDDDRRIVGMLLLRLAPDEIANLLGTAHTRSSCDVRRWSDASTQAMRAPNLSMRKTLRK